MAFTKSLTARTTFGNLAVQEYKITADAATEAIDTGLNNIVMVHAQPKSMASSPFSISKNEGVAGTSIAGTIGITGVTSGDDFYVTVYGS